MNKACISVTEIQRFSTQDGPGIRTVVFLPGCPLRCAWCHNPEAQTAQNRILYAENSCIGCRMCTEVCPQKAHIGSVGGGAPVYLRTKCNACGICTQLCPSGALTNTVKYFTPEEILAFVRRDEMFYGKEGGLTLSGGEPLAHPRESLSLLQKARACGIGTVVETCGFAERQDVLAAAKYTDLFLWDVKDTDAARHYEYTGVFPDKIIDNLFAVDASGAATILRCILVKGVNTETAHYHGIAALFAELKHCRGVQLLPYHTFGSAKAVQLGMPDNAHRDWILTEQDLSAAMQYLENKDVKLL